MKKDCLAMISALTTGNIKNWPVPPHGYELDTVKQHILNKDPTMPKETA